MPTASEQLATLDITLPPVPAPVAAYLPSVRTGNLVFTAGQLPFVDGVLPATGKVGKDVTAADANGLARIAALNAVAVVAAEAGGIDNIARIVKVNVYVASDPDFITHSAIANGASDLLVEIFGDAGKHARSTLGMAVLPMDSPVEVEIVAELAA
ncbi:MAG: LysR family transcriptional regulator [Frankiales bacterium]|nr:LysR family transcriptional regulator [Frankiales bacterium]